jgi:hypothetical protein
MTVPAKMIVDKSFGCLYNIGSGDVRIAEKSRKDKLNYDGLL